MVNYNIRVVCVAALLVFSGLDTAYAQTNVSKIKLPADTGRKASDGTPDEVVNSGYQSVPKKMTAGAITGVAVSGIRDLSDVSIDKRLQGLAAGLQVINTSGYPGSGGLNIIRGISSVNAFSEPLYIVDGIPVKNNRFLPSLTKNADNNPLADLNPQDIVSVTVLKDAQATAVYGMRGANGAIIINTYGGTSGKTYLDLTAYTGVMQAPSKRDVLNADQYRAFILEKEKARGLTDQQIAAGAGRFLLISTPADQVERYNNNTDWQEPLYRTGITNNFHLNLRGGDAVARYALTVGYTTIRNAIDQSNFNRFSTRFNLDYKVGAKLSFLNTLYYAQTNRSIQDAGNAFNSSPLFLTTVKSPVLTSFVQDENGRDTRDIDSADYAGRNNPYSVMNRMLNENSTNRILAKIVGQYQFSPYLVLRLGIFADYYRLNERRFRPSAGFVSEGYVVRASSEGNAIELMGMSENTLNYNRSFKNDKHVVNAFVGNSVQSTTQDGKALTAVNSVSDEFVSVTTSDVTQMDTLWSYNPTWRLVSFFAGGQYTYNGKYIFSASLRADGSSRFAKGKQWGYFPAAAIAWRLSRERFMANVKAVSDLKIRASFGITGNQEVGYYNSFNALVSAPYNNYSSIKLGLLGNKNFQWEQTRQFNVGVDAELFSGRLGFSIDVYHKKTDHLFNTIMLPGTSGFSQYVVSDGAVRNTGVELSAFAQVLKVRDFSWHAQLNISHNKNVVLALPERMTRINTVDNYTTILRVGNALGSFYGYQANGVYAKTPDAKLRNGAANTNPFQAGDMMFEDINKDGIIDEKDRTVIGNSNPDFFGGITNTFTFKKITLRIFMDYAVGNDIYNAQRAALESMSGYDNQLTSISRRWKADGDITDMPRLLHGDAVGNTRFSSRWIEDGSFLRIRDLSLSYDLPLTTVLKKAFKSARVSVSAQNVHSFTKYSGYGIDVGGVSSPLYYGVDYGNLPQLRTFLLGVKLGL